MHKMHLLKLCGAQCRVKSAHPLCVCVFSLLSHFNNNRSSEWIVRAKMNECSFYHSKVTNSNYDNAISPPLSLAVTELVNFCLMRWWFVVASTEREREREKWQLNDCRKKLHRLIRTSKYMKSLITTATSWSVGTRWLSHLTELKI